MIDLPSIFGLVSVIVWIGILVFIVLISLRFVKAVEKIADNLEKNR